MGTDGYIGVCLIAAGILLLVAVVMARVAGVPSKAAVHDRVSVRRGLSWALAAALCVAALMAIGAILSGNFDETDGRVIATSLGIAVFSATAAAGASLRFREAEKLRTLGFRTMVLSVVSFALLPAALWSDGDDEAWHWFGSVALAALASRMRHWCQAPFGPSTPSPSKRLQWRRLASESSTPSSAFFLSAERWTMSMKASVS